ncbi:MAG TPA: hypothetical protein VHE78_02700 [Gemmatimonadaceae bacterium]|nr:hypothetical protein [Gemmatimonadaceae bacterium]
MSTRSPLLSSATLATIGVWYALAHLVATLAIAVVFPPPLFADALGAVLRGAGTALLIAVVSLNIRESARQRALLLNDIVPRLRGHGG